MATTGPPAYQSLQSQEKDPQQTAVTAPTAAVTVPQAQAPIATQAGAVGQPPPVAVQQVPMQAWPQGQVLNYPAPVAGMAVQPAPVQYVAVSFTQHKNISIA